MATPRLPLNAPWAFEAAVRPGSMPAAAVALGVTHGAISRHVQALEVRYGVPLLRRLAKPVEPTRARIAGQSPADFNRFLARHPGPGIPVFDKFPPPWRRLEGGLCSCQRTGKKNIILFNGVGKRDGARYGRHSR